MSRLKNFALHILSTRAGQFGCLFALIVIATGCPAARGGAARGGAVRGGGPVGAIGRSGTRGSSGAPAVSAAARVAQLRSVYGLSSRPFAIRLRNDGLIEATGTTGSWSRSLARIYQNGGIWTLDARGSATRMVGKINRDGTIWEVSETGRTVRQVGSIRATITGNRIYIRSRPQTLAGIIGELSPGDSITVYGHVPGWYRVMRSDSVSGWVAASSVSGIVDWSTIVEDADDRESYKDDTRRREVFVTDLFGGFTMNIPRTWRTVDDGQVKIFAPDGGDGKSPGVTISTWEIGNADLQRASAEFMRLMERGNKGWQRMSRLEWRQFEKRGMYFMRFQRPSITVNGKTDYITIYTTELSRMAFHGKMLYIIAAAPSDEYHYYSRIFESMISSARIM